MRRTTKAAVSLSALVLVLGFLAEAYPDGAMGGFGRGSPAPSPLAGETLRQYLKRAGVRNPIGRGEKLFGINLDCTVDTRMDMTHKGQDPTMLRVQLTDGKVVGIYLPTGQMVSFIQLYGFGDAEDATDEEGFKNAISKERALEIARELLKEMGDDLSIDQEDVRKSPAGTPPVWEIVRFRTYHGIETGQAVRITLTAKSGRVRAFSAIPLSYSGPTEPKISKKQAIEAVNASEKRGWFARLWANDYDAELRISRANSLSMQPTEEPTPLANEWVLCWYVMHRAGTGTGTGKMAISAEQGVPPPCRYDAVYVVDALTGRICRSTHL